MDNIFVNIIILPMLGYFQLSKAIFHYSKLFHLTLFMVICGYSEFFFGYL
jgi:hypothetical protein